MFSAKISLLLCLLVNLQWWQTSSAEKTLVDDQDLKRGEEETSTRDKVNNGSLLHHREKRQLVGVHIFKAPGSSSSLSRDIGLHGGHGFGGFQGGHGFGSFQGGHGGYGHDIHDLHGGGYGHESHASGYGGYKEPPKKVKYAPYYGPRYSPYDLIAPDKSKKGGKAKYGDDPVNESKKGGYHSDKHDKPIKHFGGFGGGGSVGYNAGSLKGHEHGGGYKGHGGGGFKGHGGGGFKGHGGGGFKGYGGGGGGFKGHGGGGGGFKGHGGGGGGFKGHGGGGGFKGHGGGGGFKGHGGGGGFKDHGGGGGGFKDHEGAGFKSHGGGGYKDYVGGGGGIKDHGGRGEKYSHYNVKLEHDHKLSYGHLKSPYNTYDAHANIRTGVGKGSDVDVTHMLLSDPYNFSKSSKKEPIALPL